MRDVIGIDVSKAFLDAYKTTTKEHKQFPNNPRGCCALLRWLDHTKVIFEATGSYHRVLEKTLAETGIAFVKVNPRQARRFAEAAGFMAKTDKIDAAMLAKMEAALDLKETTVKVELLHVLKELSMSRLGLIKDRTATANRLQIAQQALVRRQLKARLRFIEKQLAELDGALIELIESDDQLNRRYQILRSIPGIGAITAITMLIEMPELGSLDSKEAASLAGLAPLTRQSGTWKGNAYIKGGRRTLRCAMYMPAVVALRFNPDLKQKYTALREFGKPAKVAITAIMRKLIIIANALLKQERMWSDKTA
ncbi:IS110 family transposase [Mesorhizobium sp. SB112]|uniref:IS110 family transposase n=1 Tax=Mesorhizobium sp. SB112 TaxID=3151853 RepID=UPI00326476BE